MTNDCLVGIDGSEVSINALRWAIRNQRSDGDRVIAFTAWHVPIALKTTMAKRSLVADRLGLEAEANHVNSEATRAVDPDREHRGDIGTMIVEGRASSALLDASANASLVVLGRRGVGDLRHLILGSVSRHCATHAIVPTVIVPPGFDGPRAKQVVVGFDGSEHAQDALRWALEFFDESASIRIVAAIDLSPWLDVESTLNRFPKEVELEEQRLIAAISAVDPESRAEREIMLHGPKQALAEASGSADIVVLGARGHGAIGSAMLGSVSTWMLHRAVCPVAIVPTQT